MAVSQGGVAVKVTRAQVVSGLQPAIAMPSGTLLGRASSGTGAPETLTLGGNLVLNGGTLSSNSSYLVSAQPAGTVPVAADLVAMGQNGANTAVSYAQFLGGLPGVPSLNASQMLVTPTGASTSQKLADFAAQTLPTTGGTLTGALTLAANPTAALQAATKQYVDAQATAALPTTGGTLTGPLTLAADPTAALQAATKEYVDAQVGTALPKAGGTMTGLLALSADPVASTQAATKHYVDTQLLTSVPVAGGTMTGALTLAADPTTSLQAATKHYVDSNAGSGLPVTGGTLTGPLTLAADPTVALQAATKEYVDAQVGTALPKAGGTLTGILALAADPVASAQAATKHYVDTQVSTAVPVVGGTMTGALMLASDPQAPLQAATKHYVDSNAGSGLPMAGGTLTGPLTLAADPASALQAATKEYVDAQVGTALPKAGGTLTGILALAADPVASSQAATKHYVDTQVLTSVPVAGGTMTGALTLAADPTASLQAATKHYVDTSSASGLPVTGGTLTGTLTLAADPTQPLQAATKHYVDTSSACGLPVTGGTLTGPLLLSNNPSMAMQATTKQYVDTQAATALPQTGGTLTGALTLAADPQSSLQAATKHYVDTAALPIAGGTLTGTLALGSHALTGSAVAFTGGTLDNMVLGGTTPAALHATTGAFSGALNVTAGGMSVVGGATADTLTVGTGSGAAWSLGQAPSGSILTVQSPNTAAGATLRLKGNNAGFSVQNSALVDVAQFVDGSSGNPANWLVVKNAVSGSSASLSTAGTDTNRNLTLMAAGTGTVITPVLTLGTNFTLSGTTANYQQPLAVTAGYTGTVTDTSARMLNSVLISSDTVTGTPSVHGVDINHQFGGGAASGNRIALATMAHHVGQMTGGGFFTGGEFNAWSKANAGGTDFTSANSAGITTGSNPVVKLQSGATFFRSLTGEEIDFAVETGATTKHVAGLLIVPLSTHAVAGNDGLDSAVIIAAQGGATAGLPYGIVFGFQQSQWPFDPSNPYASLITVQNGFSPSTNPPVIAWGIDFLQLQATQGVFRAPGTSIDPAGNYQIGTGYIEPQSNGLAIDVIGQVVTAVVVANGGANYLPGIIIKDTIGGLYTVASVSGGAVASVTILQAPVAKQPTITVSTTSVTPNGTGDYGSGCTLMLTWSAARTSLSLNPSGGPVTFGGMIARQGLASSAPATGATITIAAGVSDYRILGGGTLASLTVQLPTSPINGQLIRICSQIAITALTVKDGSGGTADVQTPPAWLAAGGGFSAQWGANAAAWWCSVGA